jgi:hypothetical protein
VSDELASAPATSPVIDLVPAAAAGDSSSSPATPALTAYQKRKQRERAREERREKARQRREAKKADPAQPGEAAAPAAPPEDIDEAKLKRSLAVFLHLPWWLLSLGARILGFRAKPLTKSLALEHAEHWVPIALHYAWLRVTARVVAAPVLLVADFLGALERKDDTGKERAA